MIYYYTRQSSVSNSFTPCTVQECVSYFKDKQWVELDTETTGSFDHNNTILLIQFGDGNNQFVLNFPELSPEERTLINTGILCNAKLTKLLHNSKFDIKFLWHHGLDIVNVYDTMLAELILNAGRDVDKGFYSLYGLCQRYLGVTLDKETRGIINRIGITTRVIEYAANDVKYLSLIAREQIKLMQKYKLASEDLQDLMTVCGLEMNAILAFASMEYNGMKLDIGKWQKVKEHVNGMLEETKQQVDLQVNKEPRLRKFTKTYQDLFTPAYETTSVNWNSPAQKLKVLQALFPEIKSTDKRILSRYKSKHPLIAELVKHSKVQKLKSTYADKMETYINKTTGRIHTDIWPMVDTGRISSKDPNLLNIPSRTEEGRMMRACFVPEKGYEIVGGDYSGAELRIIAEYSKDPIWLDAFANNKDLHSELCAMTFDIPISEVKTPTSFKPDLIYRDVQKTINFGLAYGMSEYKLADEMEVEVDVASDIISKFFSRVPGVKRFLDMLGNLGKQRGFIRTPPPWRRIRWFDKYKDKNDFEAQGHIERQSKNTPIQGCNADMIKYALVLMYRHIKSRNLPVKLLISVYDEVQTEAREDISGQWSITMSEIMVNATKYSLPTVGMEVDCKISDHWSK